MSWFSDLWNQVEAKAESIAKHTQLEVKLGAGGTDVNVIDTRSRAYFFWGVVVVVLAFFLGRHFK